MPTAEEFFYVEGMCTSASSTELVVDTGAGGTAWLYPDAETTLLPAGMTAPEYQGHYVYSQIDGFGKCYAISLSPIGTVTPTPSCWRIIR